MASRRSISIIAVLALAPGMAGSAIGLGLKFRSAKPLATAHAAGALAVTSEEIFLVKNGKAGATVVVEQRKNATSEVDDAASARVLADWIKKITDAALPIVDTPPPSGTAIYVGTAAVKAGLLMKEYWTSIDQAFANLKCHSGSFYALPLVYTPEFLAKCQGLLAKASAEAKEDKNLAARVAMHVEGFKNAVQFRQIFDLMNKGDFIHFEATWTETWETD